MLSWKTNTHFYFYITNLTRKIKTTSEYKDTKLLNTSITDKTIWIVETSVHEITEGVERQTVLQERISTIYLTRDLYSEYTKNSCQFVRADNPVKKMGNTSHTNKKLLNLINQEKANSNYSNILLTTHMPEWPKSKTDRTSIGEVMNEYSHLTISTQTKHIL